MSQARKDSWRRWAAVGGGLVVAIGLLSPLSIQGEDAASSASAKAGKAAAKSERPAFDLTYVPADAMGVIAVRPNCIFRDPAMRPLAKMASKSLVEMFFPGKHSAEQNLSIEEIEQVIGSFSTRPDGKDPKGVSTLAMAPVMIRTTHDFDWIQLMRQFGLRAEKIQRQGQTYYEFTSESPTGHQKVHLYCAFPDKRTLVFLPLETCIALETGKRDQLGKLGSRPHFSWDKDWKRVEHSLVSVALDNRWMRDSSAKKSDDKDEWDALMQLASTTVESVDWKEGIDFCAFLSCKDPEAAKQATQQAKKLVAKMGPVCEGMFETDGENEPRKVDPASMPPEAARLLQVEKDLVENIRFSRRDSTVCMHTSAKLNLADIVKMFSMMAPPPQP